MWYEFIRVGSERLARCSVKTRDVIETFARVMHIQRQHALDECQSPKRKSEIAKREKSEEDKVEEMRETIDGGYPAVVTQQQITSKHYAHYFNKFTTSQPRHQMHQHLTRETLLIVTSTFSTCRQAFLPIGQW